MATTMYPKDFLYTINFFHCYYTLPSYQDCRNSISIADSKKKQLNF